MRIVIATDLTESSSDAARYAAIRARQLGAELTVAHVLGSPDISTRPILATRYQIHRSEIEQVPAVEEFERKKMTEVTEWFSSEVTDADDIEVDFIIEFGDLPDVVWRIVAEVQADSIVVGARGRQNVGRHLSRILLDATIPVIVVRDGMFPAP